MPKVESGGVMPRRGVTLASALDNPDLLGGGTIDNTSVPGREVRPAQPKNDQAAQAAINAASAPPTASAGDSPTPIIVMPAPGVGQSGDSAPGAAGPPGGTEADSGVASDAGGPGPGGSGGG